MSNKGFYCENCKYKTVSKKDFNKHLGTSKHKSQSGVNTLLTDLSPKSPLEEKIINCENCNKQYKSRVGFWKHQKKCNPINITFEKKEFKEKENMTKDNFSKDYEKSDGATNEYLRNSSETYYPQKTDEEMNNDLRDWAKEETLGNEEK